MPQASSALSIVSQPLPPMSGTFPVVPTLVLVTISQMELTRLKQGHNFWQAQHQRAVAREAVLKNEMVLLEARALHQETLLKKKIELLEAQIRDLRQRHFGQKSEAGCTPTEKQPQPAPVTKRSRGQQPGSRGHGRTKRPDLPVVAEQHELHDPCCDRCGLPYTPLKGDEESQVVEITVNAYVRRIQRNRYLRRCSCPSTPDCPKIIVAPPPPKVIPKSGYGTSIWVYILVHKFLYGQPLNRILRALTNYGSPIAAGTMTAGLKKLSEYFTPLQEAFYNHQMTELWFNNDESRWKVFTLVEGKIGYLWYLWVTRSPHVIHFALAPTRSAQVPLAHFSHLLARKVIVVCDRYSAYKMLARLNSAIILAFCWVHVRRDFLNLGRGYPPLDEWGLEWVAEIGKLYQLNKQRVAHWQEQLPLAQQSELFHQVQARLEQHLAQMKERCTQLLLGDLTARTTVVVPPTKKGRMKTPVSAPGELHEAQRKLLVSLQTHWPGLIVFVTHPHVPMDNNRGEMAIRGPVVGRKNFYGSGSTWSAELAAKMYTQLLTVVQWGLNPEHWLQEYLTACARKGGAAPADLTPFLPWAMSEDRRQLLAKPPPMPSDSP
jgi:transposase